jgi:uncharacterized protein
MSDAAAADREELGELSVVDRPDQQRYELVAGARVLGYADYRVRDDVVVLPHTVIDPGLRGRGLGDVLVAGVLADLRTRGLGVVPTCWFVAEYLDRHPGSADIAGPGLGSM